MKETFKKSGFGILNDFYSGTEVSALIQCIESRQPISENFRKSADVFAVRQLLKEIPEAASLVFNHKLKDFIAENFGRDYFAVKSIYFDKPKQSNWFVAWHQDLTISVDKKVNLKHYGPWTVKHNQYAVQPPLKILENSFTIRIHLDDTDENNGALKVIPGSHLQGIQRVIDSPVENEVSCNVGKGGIMLMKPLLFHSSGRTTNGQQRRVIHLEFSNQKLSGTLNWAEKFDLAS